MKNVVFKEELKKSVESLNYFDIIAALYCHATNSDVEAGKKIVKSMFDNSIENIEKKLSTIDSIKDQDKSS